MAQHGKNPVDFQKLIAQSQAARASLAEAGFELKHKFDIVGRVKESVVSNPAMMLGGSLVGGFLLKKFLFGKSNKRFSRKPEKEIQTLKAQRGLLAGIFAILVAVAKPAVRIYATKLVKDYFGKRFESATASRHSAPRYY